MQLSQEWIEYERTHGGRFSLSGTADEIIQQVKDLSARIKITEDAVDLIIENKLATSVPVRVYTPTGTQNNDALPLCLFSHGGGFIAGSLDSEDELCRWIARSTPCKVLSIDYRLGPTYKLPVMLEDVITVFNWAQDPGNGLVFNDTKIFAMGASAGGALSLALANHCCQKKRRDKNTSRILDGVISITPITLHPDYVPLEYQSMYTSYVENVDAPIMGSGAMRVYLNAVSAIPTDSSIFTGLSPNLGDFPPVYIATCGADPLRDDGQVLVKMFQKAGTRVKSDHYAGLPHIFWIFSDFGKTPVFKENVESGIKFVLGNNE